MKNDRANTGRAVTRPRRWTGLQKGSMGECSARRASLPLSRPPLRGFRLHRAAGGAPNLLKRTAKQVGNVSARQKTRPHIPGLARL
jgi:hypothetical protein